MITERPILFSSPMVRAILEGRKTVTRRLVKPSPGLQRTWLTHEGIQSVRRGKMCRSGEHAPNEGPYGWQMYHPKAEVSQPDSPFGWVKSPYGGPGDRLWVRETWFDDFGGEEQPRDRNSAGTPDGIVYRADHDCTSWEAGCPCNPDGKGKRSEWRPSSQMPRWASRITLEITGLRVEELWRISNSDVEAEGVPRVEDDPDGYPCLSCDGGSNIYSKGCVDCSNTGVSPRTHFARGRVGQWARNPWVWVVSFKRVSP